MTEQLTLRNPEFQAAYLANERQERLNTGKVASALVVFLMPAGIVLDWFMAREELPFFLVLRLACSSLAGIIWFLHTTSFGHQHYKALSLPIALLPAAFIAWMILVKGGPASPYYAGLNLVLLAVSVVVHWGMVESLVAVGTVHLMYLMACMFRMTQELLPIIVNNLYFLALTGIIVVTGNYFFNRLRFREFALRFELDKNKRTLEQTNQKLDTQNKELADTLQKLTEAESQLVQQEKMASLGVMSAGIIHEINNPLNYATTGLYTLRKKGKYVAAEQQADFEDVLKDVEAGVSRVKNIVSDLRMFTHPNSDSHEQVVVSEVIEPSLRFLSAEVTDRVKIEQQLPEHLTVTANKQKLIHVFTNLLQNSLDALRTKTFTDEQPTIWIEGRVENGRNLLIVRDNGHGIEKQNLDKIFDPFFTTKEVGQGMGLGLSICYRIIHESAGRISVRTEVGKFCEFTLEFPVKG